jgi:hypothetical protein
VRALLYPLGGCQRLHLLILGEHYAQALVMRVSFFWGSFRGSTGGASHISVIVVKFLTVPLNRQIKVLYHGIESISR